MTFGFVYILVNEYMPGVYKVGCTERSPHARAEELSKHTGVPAPFKVLCYIEVADFQNVERRLHEWLQAYRISASREFFMDGLEYAVRLLWWNRERVSFTEVGIGPDGCWSPLADVLAEEGWTRLQDSPDPWAPAEPKPPTPDLRVIEGGAANAA